MGKYSKAIDTLQLMQAAYSHIRTCDTEWEAVELSQEVLRDAEQREQGCEWCKSSKPLLYPKDKFCRYCGRQLNKTDKEA